MKLVSWNVNGLRSAEEKFLDFLDKEQPDILLLQELRAEPNQLSMFLQNVTDYKVLFNPSGRPGYGGSALYYKEILPLENLTNKTRNPVLDSEGRTIQFSLRNTTVINFYVPNGNMNEERLQYKLNFYRMMTKYLQSLINQKYPVIIGADMNVAHTKIDLYSPKTSIRNSGFLPEERKLFDRLLEIGLIDTFRHLHPKGGYYTWWSFRDRTRKENHGWRYDYFLVSNNLVKRIKKAEILKDVFGSDHCPILLEIDI